MHAQGAAGVCRLLGALLSSKDHQHTATYVTKLA